MYLKFSITVANEGLADSSGSELVVYADGEKIKTFDVGSLEVGVRKVISAVNVRVPTEVEKFEFVIETGESELYQGNNKAILLPYPE
jgi:hypothetical protein